MGCGQGRVERPGAGCPLCWLQTLETPSAHEAGGEPGPGHQGGLHHHHLAGREAGTGEDVATTAHTWATGNLQNIRHGV